MRRNPVILTVLLITALQFAEFDLESRDNSSALCRKAATIALGGDIEGAINIFTNVVRISPYYSLGHYGLGKAYLYKEGRLDDAIKHLKRSVELDRKLSKGYFYLGMALMFDRNYIHALHAFSDSYRYDSGLIEALYNMGVIYDLMNSRSNSKKYFDQYNLRMKKKEQGIIF
jgi:tetratricopeptide (TPR) repeat protein